MAPLLSTCTARMGPTILAADLSDEGLPVFSAGCSDLPWGYTKLDVEPYRPGTIILSARGSIGNPRLPTLSLFTSTQTTIAITCATEMEPKYLKRFLQTISWSQITSGASIPMLTIGKLAEVKLPVAPRSEQKRIADKIETMLARVSVANSRLAHATPILKRFRQSVLAAATSGRLTRNEGNQLRSRKSITVDELCFHIGDGPFGSNLKSDDYTNAGARVVRLENIGRLEFERDKKTFVSMEKYNQLVKHALQPGDILFSSFVDEEVRVCEFPSDLKDPAINKADCFCVRVDPERCNPKFLLFTFACRSTYELMKAVTHGATRPRINLKQIRGFELSLPSQDEQAEIVHRVETLFAFADRLEARLQAAQTAVDRLTPALLAKAFRGELVPQDPNDEPAAELLKRLLAASSDATMKPARKRRTA